MKLIHGLALLACLCLCALVFTENNCELPNGSLKTTCNGSHP